MYLLIKYQLPFVKAATSSSIRYWETKDEARNSSLMITNAVRVRLTADEHQSLVS